MPMIFYMETFSPRTHVISCSSVEAKYGAMAKTCSKWCGSINFPRLGVTTLIPMPMHNDSCSYLHCKGHYILLVHIKIVCYFIHDKALKGPHYNIAHTFIQQTC